jgi:hypothetical protein
VTEQNDYIKITTSRKRTRIIAIIIYSVVSTVAVILPVFFQDTMVIIMSIVIIFGGLAILFYILLNPINNPLVLPFSPDEEIVEPTEVPTEYYKEQPMTVILKIIIPLVVIYSVASVWMYFTVGMSEAIYFFAALAFFAIMGLVFSKITIHLSLRILTIRLGPFKDILNIDEIISIRSVAVKPMGSYFGYGKRIGTDGSIGYISGGNIGVRILMKNGKTYVITLNNPQEIVNVILYAKKQSSEL